MVFTQALLVVQASMDRSNPHIGPKARFTQREPLYNASLIAD